MEADATRARFAERLRALRESLSLSREQFAEIVGVKHVSQYLYELGDRVPNVDYLLKAHAAGMDIRRLLLGDHSPPRGPKAPRGLSEEQVLAVYTIIESLAVDGLGRPLPFELRKEMVKLAYKAMTEYEGPKKVHALRARLRHFVAGN